MTRSRIALNLPKKQVASVDREVQVARAISCYAAQAKMEQERRESVLTLLRELAEEHGEPRAADITWAKRSLAARRG